LPAASLYIHIPFCKSKCFYCDFFSRVTDYGRDDAFLIDNYLEALRLDIEYQLNEFQIECVPAVYIGGGTPSLLSGEQLRGLLGFLEAALPCAGETRREITVEANSESLSSDFLQAAINGGATRLSIGVQTLDDECRRACGRAGSSKLITDNLSLLKSAGQNGAGGYTGSAADISFDLISGLPLQNKSILLESIEKLQEYNPVHISLYDLTLEPGTVLHRMYQNKVFRRDGNRQDELWLSGRDALVKKGFVWYEISNFAKPGRESRHNLRYWKMENWLGAGCSASGMLTDEANGTALRRTVTRDIDEYIRLCNTGGGQWFRTEYIGRRDLMKETLMMGFRLAGGPDEALFQKRFSTAIEDAIPETISKWGRRGLYRRGWNALTNDGRLFLNAFLLDAFEEL